MRICPPFPSIALVAVLGCAGARGPAAGAHDDCASLRGGWKGSFDIEGHGLDEAPRKDRLDLILSAGPAGPHVYSLEQGRWVEVKPGAFSLRCSGPSMLLGAIDSGGDADGTWYETWSIAATTIDADRLLVRWTRIVNNVDLPAGKSGSKFSYEGSGIFQRVEVTSAR